MAAARQPLMPREGTTLRRMMDDPEFFVRFWWNKALTPAQLDFMQNKHDQRHLVFISTRQGGKTEVQALAALDSLLFDHIRTGHRVIIESYAPTQKQAKEVVFERLRELINTGMHYVGPPVPESGWAGPGSDPREDFDRNWIHLKDELMPGEKGVQERGLFKFKSNNIFRVQTASRNSEIRGYSPTIIQIDESSKIDPVMYWSDIRGAGKALKGLTADDFDMVRGMPIHEQQEFLATRGVAVRYWETGTPLGRNHFFEVAQPGSGAYVITQPWWESPVTNRADVEKDRAIMPPRQFESEYCCVFNTDVNYAFDRAAIIRACSLPPRAGYEPRGGGRYAAGIDLGQRVDHSVITIVQLIGPVRKMVAHYRWDLNRPWTEMVNEMNDIVQAWSPELVLVDRTGPNGRTIFEGYLIHFGWNLEGWHYTPDTKGELMRYLQLQFEQDRLELWEEETLMRELSSIEEKRLPGTGKPSYPKPDNGDGHDDQVQAVALAVMAAAMVSPEMDGVNQGIVFSAIQQEPQSPFSAPGGLTAGPSPWRQDTGPDVESRGSEWDFTSPTGRSPIRRPEGW